MKDSKSPAGYQRGLRSRAARPMAVSPDDLAGSFA